MDFRKTGFEDPAWMELNQDRAETCGVCTGLMESDWLLRGVHGTLLGVPFCRAEYLNL